MIKVHCESCNVDYTQGTYCSICGSGQAKVQSQDTFTKFCEKCISNTPHNIYGCLGCNSRGQAMIKR
jgi:hypothetical protein